jgi:hypothetical protein
MKIRFKILLALLVIFGSATLIPASVSGQQSNVSLQIFYDQLSPFGQWSSTPDYGYIWIPDVGPEFSPYSTNGSWVMTDYGWTWVSDYPWGWAPFHYGRWDFDNNFGWFWVPDYEWGPSWVTWRRGDGYYGWSPMRPGISVSMSFGNGYADVNRWNFVRDRDFGRSNISRYYVNRGDNDVIIRRSTVINNTYNDNHRNVTYVAGPRRDEVQKITGRSFSNVSIRDNDKPGQRLTKNQLEIYRPQIDLKTTTQRPAPARISDVKDIGPAGHRTSNFKQNNVQVQQPKQQQSQPAEPKRQDQIQVQQKQQQTESKRQDQIQVQPKQQQQTDSRKQDQLQTQPKQQQQPKQSVQQNVQGKQQVSSTARTRRLERQQNKASNQDKKGRNKENSNETSGKH